MDLKDRRNGDLVKLFIQSKFVHPWLDLKVKLGGFTNKCSNVYSNCVRLVYSKRVYLFTPSCSSISKHSSLQYADLDPAKVHRSVGGRLRTYLQYQLSGRKWKKKALQYNRAA